MATRNREELKLLLLQIRNLDDPMKQHEVDCFVDAAHVKPEQIVTIDAVNCDFHAVDLDEYDALFVGGAGEYSISSSRDPFLRAMGDFLMEVVESDYPTFASCFGFHSLAVVLGGEVVKDYSTMEVGTFELELTDAGRRDSLFSPLGNRFLAQMGHKDRLQRIPEGVDVLARGETIPCQAFRVPGKRIWATQFHPELTSEGNRHRYLYYFSQYPGKEPDPKILASFRDSPQSNELIERFLDTVIL